MPGLKIGPMSSPKPIGFHTGAASGTASGSDPRVGLPTARVGAVTGVGESFGEVDEPTARVGVTIEVGESASEVGEIGRSGESGACGTKLSSVRQSFCDIGLRLTAHSFAVRIRRW